MIRLFAAIPLPAAIADGLAGRQTGVDAADWRPAESLHLTLRFFGALREDVARDLDLELAAIALPRFELVLAGAGTFGGPEPQVLWVGVEPNAALKRLARACEAAARRAGLAAETRRYAPHVTLAYLDSAPPAQTIAWVQANNLLRSPPISVTEFGLFSSHPGRSGPHYRLEAAYPLH